MAANEVCITEYSDIVETVRGAAPAPRDPPLAVQILALTGSPAQSQAFNAATKFVRIAVFGVDARIVNNTSNPVADAALSERWLAGSTEFRSASSGMKTSVIVAT